MDRKRYSLSSILGLSIILISSCSLFESSEDEKKPAGPPRGPQTLSAEGYLATPTTVENVIEATGNLIANEQVDIRGELSGKLIGLYIREGSFIQAGGVLAKIDDTQLKAERNKLNVSLELAQNDLARAKSLLEIQGTTQEEVDRLQSQVKTVEADLAINQVQQNKTRIYAPFSGRLGLKEVSLGAYITPSTTIVSLQQDHPIKLEFEVPEKFLQRIEKGQNLSFTIQGSDQVFEATVYTKGPEISPTTRTFKVRATTPNKKHLLLPGQFATVRLVTNINDAAILIPTDAVIPTLAGKIVYVVRNGKAAATPVTTADRSSDLIEILDGITAGDTVLTSGLLSLSNGVPVQVSSLQNESRSTAE